jgi:hypothetical protein
MSEACIEIFFSPCPLFNTEGTTNSTFANIIPL